MKNLLEFEMFENDQPGSGDAGAEVAPVVFDDISFTISGVKDEAVELIAILMAQSFINSDQQEANRIIQRVKDDANSAVSYLETKIEGMVKIIPGIDHNFGEQLINQKSNLAKAMVRAIPGIVGLYVKQTSPGGIDSSKFLKPDLSRSSYFSKLGSYFGIDNN